MIDALIIGGDSRIGQALFAKLNDNDFEVVATSRRMHASWPYLIFCLDNPSWIPPAKVTYFCAAVTGFRHVGLNEDYARLINVTHTLKVARQQVERGGRVVHLSSSAASTHTDQVYGQLKVEAEAGFLKMGDDAATLRFGPVAFPGRVVYPDGPYQPISLNDVTTSLASFMVNWEPGLHQVFYAPRRAAA